MTDENKGVVGRVVFIDLDSGEETGCYRLPRQTAEIVPPGRNPFRVRYTLLEYLYRRGLLEKYAEESFEPVMKSYCLS